MNRKKIRELLMSKSKEDQNIGRILFLHALKDEEYQRLIKGRRNPYYSHFLSNFHNRDISIVVYELTHGASSDFFGEPTWGFEFSAEEVQEVYGEKIREIK